MSDMDIVRQLNELKSSIFYDILEIVGRVFIVVRYSENVMIGNRGFLENEKQEGLTLVLNTKMNFTWEDDILEAKLVFGTTTQRCVIPVQYIVALYSPELQSQFVTSYMPPDDVLMPQSEDSARQEPHKETRIEAIEGVEDNIVKVDFSKKKKK
ncbi:hypothetical protein MBAV_004936 [Candidatus Magnetobacterium bavaricum]|uniref:Stringent starvation protein B n=1 Tax=Candidatus Magnetobacterium bavaricum TaxID=29290 RepID=A0A0F3GLW2_9BACT|nr:hypothetical protein MBAV_004936 [Candidatus Magnetobacterium bavaricum]